MLIYLFSLICVTGWTQSSVRAHGYLSKIQIADTVYEGPPVAFGDAYSDTSYVIRQIDDGSPVKGASNTDIACGHGVQFAQGIATVTPGDKVSFWWLGLDGKSNWPHNTGPLMTYLASCGDSNCTSLAGTDVDWFKIDQAGRMDSNGDWYQQLFQQGKSYTIQLPSDVKPGNYLLRHEIIALHLATSEGGAEFYPACVQLSVTGSGDGSPSSDELVKFPGAYSDTDPGIYDPQVYDVGVTYQFPGPSIPSFISTGGSSSTNGRGDNSTSSGTSSDGDQSQHDLKCSLQKRETLTVRKRTLSSSFVTWLRHAGRTRRSQH